MKLHTDPRLTALGILHGTTTRPMGNMRLPKNTHALFNRLNIDEKNVARFKQIHSDKLLTISSLKDIQTTQEADGWIVTGTHLGAAILTADCVPLIVWDETASVIGLAHCGWRGVAQRLPAKTVQQLKNAGAKGKIYAWVGPHIQTCCFEVQDDVAIQFLLDIQERNGKKFVNLNQAILRQLTQEGLSATDIAFDTSCTCCQPEQFFSFRRDHQKDALMTFVYKS